MYTRANDLITLNYPTTTILTNIGLESAYRGKFIKDKEGNDKTEEVYLSPDELNFVKAKIKDIVYTIFSDVGKVVSVVSIYVDQDLTSGAPPVTIKVNGATITDNDDYITANIALADVNIENVIIYFILAEWFLKLGLADDAKLNLEKFNNYYQKMLKEIMRLRKNFII